MKSEATLPGKIQNMESNFICSVKVAKNYDLKIFMKKNYSISLATYVGSIAESVTT